MNMALRTTAMGAERETGGLDRPFIGSKGIVAAALVAANGAAIPAGALAEEAFGADNLRCRLSLTGAIGTLRKALKRTGADDRIVETGKGPTLAYAWFKPIAEPEPVAVPTAAPVTPALASKPRAITLPPCGYASWSYVPKTNLRGPMQVVRYPGEDQDRRLTELDLSNGRTTADARFVTAEDDDGGEA